MQSARYSSALALCAALLCTAPPAYAGEARVAGVARAALDSPDTIRRTIAEAAAGGATTVLIPVAAGARVDPFDGFAAAVRAAREQGLQVRAWIHVNLAAAAGELPASRDHVLYRHPEWLMVPRELAAQMLTIDQRSPEYIGRLARWARGNAERAAGVYVSPLHPEAAEYLVSAVAEIVARYDVEGVHLDALQFPGDDFDFSRPALERFRALVRPGLPAEARARLDEIEKIDPFAWPEEFPQEWQRFRASRVSDLLARLRAAVHTARPAAVISGDGVQESALARLAP